MNTAYKSGDPRIPLEVQDLMDAENVKTALLMWVIPGPTPQHKPYERWYVAGCIVECHAA